MVIALEINGSGQLAHLDGEKWHGYFLQADKLEDPDARHFNVTQGRTRQ